jgi:hypothetical protein
MHLWRLKSFCFLLFCLSFLAGCSGGSSWGNVHTEKVGNIGGVSGTLTVTMGQTFINLVSYDGSFTDAPVFIAGKSVQSMSEAQENGIRQTFANFHPIVLVHGNQDEINTLLGILGLSRNYALPEGLPKDKQYVELFAIDREAGGYNFTWVMYPPGSYPADTVTSASIQSYDTAENQSKRTKMFHRWIDRDANRVTPAINAYTQQATRILAAKVLAANETPEVVPGGSNNYVANFPLFNGNHYQIVYFMQSCHARSTLDQTDYDYFYVRQEGGFNASGAYNGITLVENDFRHEVHYYVGSYFMNSWMEGTAHDGNGVTVMTTKPSNANNVTKLTTGFKFDVGLDLSKEPGGHIGFEWENTKEVDVTDCEVRNSSMDGKTQEWLSLDSETQSAGAPDQANHNNAKWIYEFKRAGKLIPIMPGDPTLSPPPVLSRDNFEPINQWVWKCAPAVRDANKTFQSRFQVVLVKSAAAPLLGWDPSHELNDGGRWQFEVPLSYPPTMAGVPDNLVFKAAGDERTVEITASGSWSVTSDQAWCEVVKVGNTSALITVDTNDTKKTRFATVRFVTADGRGKADMKVVQGKY